MIRFSDLYRWFSLRFGRRVTQKLPTETESYNRTFWRLTFWPAKWLVIKFSQRVTEKEINNTPDWKMWFMVCKMALKTSPMVVFVRIVWILRFIAPNNGYDNEMNYNCMNVLTTVCIQACIRYVYTLDAIRKCDLIAVNWHVWIRRISHSTARIYCCYYYSEKTNFNSSASESTNHCAVGSNARHATERRINWECNWRAVQLNRYFNFMVLQIFAIP